MKNKILWIDDEIDLLNSHVLFLKSKGFDVSSATNGKDGIHMVRDEEYDMVLLDEIMPGLSGLETLEKIKNEEPGLPVVMITKNEEESLMEKAIGGKITNYLTKPVNPSQILMVCKQVLEQDKISSEKIKKEYMEEFKNISNMLYTDMDYNDWIEVYNNLAEYEIEFDEHPDLGLKNMLEEQKKDCNNEFGKYIENNYIDWLDEKIPLRPTLSTDILSKYVFPPLENDEKVLFLVIDCLRLDQWKTFVSFVYDYFNVETDYYFSILPSATPFSRNSIFSGRFPGQLQNEYSNIWDTEKTMNRFEEDMLKNSLKRRGLLSDISQKYIKIINSEQGWNLESKIKSYLDNNLISIVINFVDVLAHRRSESGFLKEIVPDEASYRSILRNWFERSWIMSVLKKIKDYGFKVVLTSDHGSIRVMNDVKIKADRETSSSVRFKYGTNLDSHTKEALVIKEPEKYKLPRFDVNTNFVIAKEDFYFVYPTNYNEYKNKYKDTFQHGGISMEEMILPIVTMEPKS